MTTAFDANIYYNLYRMSTCAYIAIQKSFKAVLSISSISVNAASTSVVFFGLGTRQEDKIYVIYHSIQYLNYNLFTLLQTPLFLPYIPFHAS